MAVSAAAEERAVGVCSQTICSSGSGLVSQLEDFLMEVSPQGTTLQNTHGGICLASKAPKEKAWPAFQTPPVHRICLPLTKYCLISLKYLSLLACSALVLPPCWFCSSKDSKKVFFFFFFALSLTKKNRKINKKSISGYLWLFFLTSSHLCCPFRGCIKHL